MKQKRNVAKQACRFEKERVYPNQYSNYICEGIHNDCLSCGVDITHPLCPNCIAKAFNIWTKKFPEHRSIKSKLNAFMKFHNHIQEKSKPCVSCQNSIHICPLCFTTHLHSLVKEAGLGVNATIQFLFIFNFDFEHTGYSRELDFYGGY